MRPGSASFTVGSLARVRRFVTVAYATSDGTATAASSDFIATSGLLAFPAGTVSQSVAVSILADTAFEGDETFSVVLASPAFATIGDGIGAGLITDDNSFRLARNASRGRGPQVLPRAGQT